MPPLKPVRSLNLGRQNKTISSFQQPTGIGFILDMIAVPDVGFLDLLGPSMTAQALFNRTRLRWVSHSWSHCPLYPSTMRRRQKVLPATFFLGAKVCAPSHNICMDLLCRRSN